ADHQSPFELFASVVADLGARALDPDLGPEVHAQPPRRAARLREVLDLDDPPHAHVDAHEVVERDLRFAHASPMTFMRRDSAVMANARVSFIVTPNGVGSSSAMPCIHLGRRTPSAAGPTSTSVRWIASRYLGSRSAISRRKRAPKATWRC